MVCSLTLQLPEEKLRENIEIAPCNKTSRGCAAQLLEEKLQEEASWPEQEQSLFKLDAIGMWTKLRPGVRAMLAQLAPLFQMWIFTNGTRYACMRRSRPELTGLSASAKG